MDIDQKLEFVDFNADVLTENDVVDHILSDSTKLATAAAIYDALTDLSLSFDSKIVDESNQIVDLETFIRATYLPKAETYSNAELNDILKDFQPKGNYLTSHQSLANIYTKQQADSRFLTAHQSLDNYYKKKDVFNKSEIQNQLQNYSLVKDVVLLSAVSNRLALSSLADLNLSSYQKAGNYVSSDLFQSIVTVLNSSIASLQNADTTLNRRLKTLSTEVQTKIDFTEVEQLSGKLYTKNELSTADQLSTKFNSKADLRYVNQISAYIKRNLSTRVEIDALKNDLTRKIDEKCNQTYFDELSSAAKSQFQTVAETLKTKVDKSTISKLQSDINQLSTTIKTDVDNKLIAKADITTLQEVSSTINKGINTTNKQFGSYVELSTAAEISVELKNLAAGVDQTKVNEIISDYLKTNPISQQTSAMVSSMISAHESAIQQDLSNYVKTTDVSSVVKEILQEQQGSSSGIIDSSVFADLVCEPDEQIGYYIELLSTVIDCLKKIGKN